MHTPRAREERLRGARGRAPDPAPRGTWRHDLEGADALARLRAERLRPPRRAGWRLRPAPLLTQSLVAAAVLALILGAARLPDPLGAAVRDLVGRALHHDVSPQDVAAWLRERGVSERAARLVQAVLRPEAPAGTGQAPADEGAPGGAAGSGPDAAAGAGAGQPQLQWPVRGTVTSGFDWRRGADGREEFHEGIDIAARAGDPVLAAAGGTMTRVERSPRLGLYVEVDHGGGWSTRYAHLAEALVGVGAQVAAGQVLGRVGQSAETGGPHLHFELRVGGVAVDPLPKLPPAPGGS